MSLASDWAATTLLIAVVLAALLVFITSLRKGWLPNIVSKWISVSWHSVGESKKAPETELSIENKRSSDLIERSLSDLLRKNIREFNVVFTDDARNHLAKFMISGESLLDMLNKEFRSHVNYFIFDLEDYVMPVQRRYLVYLDKIGNNLTIKGVFLCTQDQAELASWNDILSQYRRISRLDYRNPESDFALLERQLQYIRGLHFELSERIAAHFEKYSGIRISSSIRSTIANIDEMKEAIGEEAPDEHELYIVGAEDSDVKLLDEDLKEKLRKAKDIAFLLQMSFAAARESATHSDEMKMGLLSDTTLRATIVSDFERSLQFLHKVITGYPPVQEPALHK